MAEPMSAEIIPFPAAPSATPFYIPAVPPPAGDTLSAALDSLSDALTEQHYAIQRWRVAMADLATSMRTLSNALPQHMERTSTR
jgi:hypothetical protein